MIRTTTEFTENSDEIPFYASTEQIRRKMLMLDFVLYNLMYFFCRISQFYETFILNIEILSSPTASLSWKLS